MGTLRSTFGATVPPNKGMNLTRSAPPTRTAALAGYPQCSAGMGVLLSLSSFVRALSASDYCLSYTAVFLTVRPWKSLPACVIVRVLPSPETAALAVMVTFPAFFQTFS